MSGFFDALMLPFAFPFMQQAFIISVLIAAPMALLSCFLVLKGWSLMGDAVSHAVLPGVVIAYIIGIPFAIGRFRGRHDLRCGHRLSEGEQPCEGRHDYGRGLLGHVRARPSALHQNSD